MFKRLTRLAFALVVVIAPGSALAAEDWVLFENGSSGKAYIDVNGTSREGDIASGWVRVEGMRTDRTGSGKKYNNALMLMDYDCRQKMVRMSHFIALDNRGGKLEDLNMDMSTWKPVEKDSFDIPLSNAFCLLSAADRGPDIRAGTWRAAAQEKGYRLSVLWSQIIQASDNEILVVAREDFDDYQTLEGLPYKHVLIGTLFDCRKRVAAVVRNEYFVDWNRRVFIDAVAEKDIRLKPLTPGSPGYRDLDEMCSAPHVASEARAGAEAEQGISTGTAWATNKGYLVTASHVIDGGKKIEVYQDSQKIGEAKVVANDPANDVALLKFVPAGGKKIRIIPLADKPGAMGKSVFTLGFPAPDVMGQAIKMSAGDISATSGIQDDARFMQMSIPIQPGNSGGPVIGFDGAAVGVVSAKLAKLSEDRDEVKPENVNYAVKIAYVRPLLEELPDLADYVPVKATGGNTEDLIAQAREAVFMLVVRP
jgi:S1-C subfamily serine protease